MKMIKLTAGCTDGTPIYINPNNINRISIHKSFNRPTKFTYIDMIGDSDDSHFEVQETVDEVLAMLSDSTDEMQYRGDDVGVIQFIQGWLSCKAEVLGLINKYFPDNGKPVPQTAIVDFIDAVVAMNGAENENE